MGYTEYAPQASLQTGVKCFWSIRDEPSDNIQEVWPDGCVELVFSLGNIFKVSADGSSRPFPRVMVVGLQTQIMRVRCDGVLRLLGARLLPFGLGEWQPEQLETLADTIEPLLRKDRFADAVKLLEVWLERQPGIDDHLNNRFYSALRRLYADSGNLTVSQLAAAQGLSTRQLERMFAGKLGVSPKMLARVVRFARSWSLMLSNPDLCLADLALELGYSDQAHFSNEFQSFGRQSPRAFRKGPLAK